MPIVQIFAKPPVPGKVKTRLMVDIGPQKACSVYQYCLHHSFQVITESTYDYQLWLSEPSFDHLFDVHPCHYQQGDNLGHRMLHALHQGLAVADDSTVILIGSDCLDLRAAHLAEAVYALNSNDLVFLPCIDGGFALIGCRQLNASLFDDVVWSSETVLQRILKNASDLNRRVALLETVRDIDTLHDLNQYPQLRELVSTIS